MLRAFSSRMCAKSVDELLVYQKALAAADEISAILKRSDFRSDLRLRGQMAASSERVASVIAEGFGQSTDRHFAEYLHRSCASTYEIRAQLAVAQGRRYVTAKEFNRLAEAYDEIARMSSGLINYLKRSDRKDRRWTRSPRDPPLED